MYKKSLNQLYLDHRGRLSDKWSLYIEEYARLFEGWRAQKIRMLEIGIQNGGSLDIWLEYFPHATKIVGSDIDIACAKLVYLDSRVHIIIGDANVDDVAKEILAECDSFDIVIDDGSHRSSDIVRSFARYFESVVDGGLYVAEDLHCSYWESHEGGLFYPLSSIAFFKALVDVVSHEHWGVQWARKQLVEEFCTAYQVDISEEALRHIHSVEFVNSMCVIRKMAPAANVLGSRFISGQDAFVSAEMINLHASESNTPSQMNNLWSSSLPWVREAERQAKFDALVGERDLLEADVLLGNTKQVALVSDVEALTIQSAALFQQSEDYASRIDNLLSRNNMLSGDHNALLAKYKTLSGEHSTLLAKYNMLSIKHAQLRRISSKKLELLEVNQRIEAALNPARKEMQAIRNSTSWRVTAPLRWVGHGTLPLRNMLRAAPAVLERNGGVSGTSKQIFKLWQETGWRGVSRNLRQMASGAKTSASDDVAERIHDYQAWIDRYDTLDDQQRDQIRARIRSMIEEPLISILMPTYKAVPLWLCAAVESVQKQLYSNWELCIADDASRSPELTELLDSLARNDPRIKVVHRQENGHISAASNSALALATGRWIVLMDHDDLLSEHALYWMADYIDNHPEVRLIYSDEDKIDDQGVRKDPYFKSDWNVDLFYSQNMFSHLGLYDASLVRQVGGFRVGFEGSQDYDLVLRCIEHLQPSQIGHVPKVLYHWRVHPLSTASSLDAKPYAQLAGEKALNEHFLRSGIRGHVEYVGNGYRAFYDIPDPEPLVSLIIPTRNAMELVRQCIDSILERTTYKNYEIILIDNGSDDQAALDYFRLLSENPRICVVREDSEFNYSALNNAAVRKAKGEYVGLINNDIEVITPEWLSDMVAIANQPGVGAVGARLWYPDYTLQHGGVILGIGGVAGHSHKRLPKERRGYFERAALMQSFSAVTAACLVIQKKHYLAVGGLNEVDLKVAFNDVDFCIRLRDSGLRNVWTPYAELLHHESATRGDDIQPEKQRRFESEARYMLVHWGDTLNHDPAYNPNLTLAREDFSLAWPPTT